MFVMSKPTSFDVHKEYLLRSLSQLPKGAAKFDYSRLTILYFIVLGLDVLDGLESLSDDYKRLIVDWVYGLQLVPNENQPPHKCGFMGSTTVIHLKKHPGCEKYCEGNVAMTYMALCILITLGDDLTRVNKPAILQGVAALQKPNGSFKSSYEYGESDLRFVYCSVGICNILNDSSTIDVSNTMKFILNCFNYDGAFGQNPGSESHGGSTYCAIASLSLLDKLNCALDKNKFKTVERWAVHRQTMNGFQGRPNKESDTCYSFWLGATLSIMGSIDKINKDNNRHFIMSNANHVSGGFSKNMYCIGDPMHTCLSLCALSLTGEQNLNPINPTLIITERAANYIKLLNMSS